jgi:hypothetical protein
MNLVHLCMYIRMCIAHVFIFYNESTHTYTCRHVQEPVCLQVSYLFDTLFVKFDVYLHMHTCTDTCVLALSIHTSQSVCPSLGSDVLLMCVNHYTTEAG